MEEIKIERCPHCGGVADLTWDDERIWVECLGCRAKGPSYSGCMSCVQTGADAVVMAVDDWNKRDDGKREQVDKTAKQIADEFFAAKVGGGE